MTTDRAVEFVILMLIVAAIVAVLAERLRMPYTVALVLGGLALGSVPLPLVESLVRQRPHWLTPEVTLTVFLPPLLFEGSLKMQIRHLRESLPSILALATLGVVVTTVVAGWTVHLSMHFPLLVALVFGAVVAATDPISVLAIFKDMAVSRRLSTVVEGESLLNDGTAAVLFGILVAAVGTGDLSLRSAAREFVVVALGGAVVGMALGYVFSKVTERLDEPHIEITLTTVLAYGAYLAAESLHVSGVIATVAGGLMMGNVGAKYGMSPRTRIALWSFWEYASFVINSIVFLLIGLEVRLEDLWAGWRPIAFAVGAILLGRVLAIYTLVPATNLLGAAIPFRWQQVLVLGGMRGALSLALALSLDARFPHRGEILTMAFGVVAFTIVVQGLSIKPALRLLGIGGGQEGEFELTRVRQMALLAARSELQDMLDQHVLSAPVHGRLSREIDDRLAETRATIDRVFQQDEARFSDELRIAQVRLLAAERSAIEQALHDGLISPQAATRMIGSADREVGELSQPRAREEERPGDDSGNVPPEKP
jgi:CPA1 family monovalent cation:H+ antiporter